MATHSPNQPFFFERKGADVRVLAVCDGTLRFEGTPSEVLTEENILEIYRVRSRLMKSPGPDEHRAASDRSARDILRARAAENFRGKALKKSEKTDGGFLYLKIPEKEERK